MSAALLLVAVATLGRAAAAAAAAWGALALATGCRAPVLVLLSGGMAHSSRGDALLVALRQAEPHAAGDLVAFRVDGRDVVIVHRVIRSHGDPDGFRLLTKGDENVVDD
eukprot:gene3771-8245_t